MKQYQITGPNGLDALTLAEVPEPKPGPHEVLVEMRAWSLNYRDLSMPHGGYAGNQKVKTNPPLVPLSDGAGEVIAVGEQVKRLQVGDRVCPIFFQRWLDGDLTRDQISSALGGACDGVLSQRVALHHKGVVKFPDYLSFEQAATLPCAAVTAWQALTLAPGLKAGQTILALGTGGVSVFALQFAKMYGAKVIITSSSNEKLERARELGADHTINYHEVPQWHEQVLSLTAGNGVDNVIEVGGTGTFQKSMQAAAVSGRVSLIGVLTGNRVENPSPLPIIFSRLSVQGIYVGSRQMFEEMNRALECNRIEPVIDRTFPFDNVRAAYEHIASGSHFGKVVITC